MFKNLFLVLFCLLLVSCDSITRVPKVIYKSSLQADSIIVDKSEKKLYLLKNGKVIRDYDTQMGYKEGRKQFEGDERTPEGKYFISNKNQNSSYFLSLAISYPNEEDRKRAAALGKRPGGDIMVHGMPNQAGVLERIKKNNYDWTAGCIAVSDHDMVEIYAMVQTGVPILIRK